MRGLGGDDTLTGHDGADLLDGGDGNDLLLGGGDDFTDRFVFSVAPGAANADLIFNFVSLEDKIVLDGAMHANSGPSATSPRATRASGLQGPGRRTTPMIE